MSRVGLTGPDTTHLTRITQIDLYNPFDPNYTNWPIQPIWLKLHKLTCLINHAQLFKYNNYNYTFRNNDKD